MKKNNLKKDLNSVYGAIATGYIDTDSAYTASKYLEEASKYGWHAAWLRSLPERELISKIFYYSGRALQYSNYNHVEDAITLQYFLLEYARRNGGQRI